MPSDKLIVHKDGKTRRATDQAHFDRLIKAGWNKGKPAKNDSSKQAKTVES